MNAARREQSGTTVRGAMFRNSFPGHGSIRPNLARLRWEYHWRRLLRSLLFVGVEALAFAAPVLGHVYLLLRGPGSWGVDLVWAGWEGGGADGSSGAHGVKHPQVAWRHGEM